MKRSILALVLALAMALALAACGRGDETAASAQPTADTAKKAENITLCPTYDNDKGGYFSVTLPASWGDHYLTECGANDGGYYVGFYEKTCPLPRRPHGRQAPEWYRPARAVC